MLQYRQADPSHVDHEGRRLHSEARAPAGVGSGTCGLLALFPSFPFRSSWGDEETDPCFVLNGVFDSKAYQPVTYTWM